MVVRFMRNTILRRTDKGSRVPFDMKEPDVMLNRMQPLDEFIAFR